MFIMFVYDLPLFFAIGAIFVVLILVLYIFLYSSMKKEEKKMMEFLQTVPQDVKDYLISAEIKTSPFGTGTSVQKGLIYRLDVKKKTVDLAIIYSDKQKNSGKFCFCKLPVNTEIVVEHNLKVNDIIDVRFSDKNIPERIV